MKSPFVSFSILSTLALALPLATSAVQAFQPTTTGGGFSSMHSTALVAQATQPTTTGGGFSSRQPALVAQASTFSQAFQPTTTGGGYSSLTRSALMAQAPTRIAATGMFVAAEQPTSGMAQIVVENGQRYLVLDSSFKTSSQGPDLHVVLDPTNQPPAQYQDKTRFVNLGKLQKFAGTQRYAIPASVDLAKFKSVGIWCQMANATFGYAPLSPASAASL